jgi:transcriptional regulator with XRE-family HTH domain
MQLLFHLCNFTDDMMRYMYAEAIEILKNKKIHLKMDQVELAEKANISPAQVSRILTLKSVASTETLASLATALGLPAASILQIAERLPKSPESDPLIEEGTHILQQLKDLDMESAKNAVGYLQITLQVAQDKGKYDARNRKGKTRPSTVK